MGLGEANVSMIGIFLEPCQSTWCTGYSNDNGVKFSQILVAGPNKHGYTRRHAVQTKEISKQAKVMRVSFTHHITARDAEAGG
jgi:hypothetical protein